MIARPILGAVVLAGLMLAASAIIKYAEANHVIGPDTATRAIQVTIGLALAFYANFIPKKNPTAAQCVQSAQRVAGWAFVIAGLGYAAIWALAPLATADLVGTPLVASAIAITFGYALWAYATRPRNQNGQAAQ